MTGAVGTAALALGVVAATVSATAWTLSARGSKDTAARGATWAMLAFAVLAAGALETALVTHDFSVRFVADNGGRSVPLYYTVTSMWSALEGSLLLWILVLTLVAAVAMRRVPSAAPELHPIAMAVISGVAVFFFALALGGGNAFHAVSPVPSDGPGPNPLLQDHPAMGVHPPLLYAGYVALTVPFAYSVAALVTGRVNAGWVRAVRGWTLSAWAFLTAGILLGAWWSYAVLGWGGYWAWDPVENASILPWLTSTALLHSVIVQGRRRTLLVWNISLAALSFLLVLVGTFLTRSGVVESVHAFTQSPLGPMLLGFIALVSVGWLSLVLLRADLLSRRDEGVGGAVLSRQTSLVANNLLLTVIAFTVLLGTVFPLIHQMLTGDRVSVGPPYFTRMVTPLAFTLLLLMAVGPLLAWDRAGGSALRRRAVLPTTVSAVGAAAAAVAGVGDLSVLLSVALALFVLTTLVTDTLVRLGVTAGATAAVALGHRRRHVGVLLAHVGVTLMAVAVTVSSAYSTSVQRTLTPGETVAVAGVSATLGDVERGSDTQRMSATADLQVGAEQGGYPLRPELSMYRARSMVVASPAIRSTWRHDVYATLLEVDPEADSATVRLAVNPFVGLLWAAGGILLAGAGLAAWPVRPRRQVRAETDRPTTEQTTLEPARTALPAEEARR